MELNSLKVKVISSANVGRMQKRGGKITELPKVSSDKPSLLLRDKLTY